MVNSEEACKKAMVCSTMLLSHICSVDKLYALGKEYLLIVCATISKVYITKAALSAVDTIVSFLSVVMERVIMP